MEMIDCELMSANNSGNNFPMLCLTQMNFTMLWKIHTWRWFSKRYSKWNIRQFLFCLVYSQLHSDYNQQQWNPMLNKVIHSHKLTVIKVPAHCFCILLGSAVQIHLIQSGGQITNIKTLGQRCLIEKLLFFYFLLLFKKVNLSFQKAYSSNFYKTI